MDCHGLRLCYGAGEPLADLPMARAWLSMLVFFDLVFLTLALWTFEPVMTE